MPAANRWPAADRIRSDRLVLDPLQVSDAEDMVAVLAPVELYAFTGGEPPTLDRLRERYAIQVAGRSPDGEQGWLNWVLRWAGSADPLGYVQATVTELDGVRAAEVAWVVTPAHQGRGVAGEAAGSMVAWLLEQGVSTVLAHLHPDHAASAGVARRAGLAPTDVWEDGERRWELRATPSRSGPR